MGRRLSLLVMGALLSACASTVTTKTAVKAPVVLPPASAEVRLDSSEFLRALNEAQIQLASRAQVAPVLADARVTVEMQIPDHQSVQGAIRYFSNDLHKTIQRSLTRSAKYKPMIDKVLDDLKLPRGLAYLPVIESAFTTTLTSTAGAHGIWQFMPPTAREYGLKVDWWIDERADAEKSTRAAAKFLRNLNREFKGDWPLTLAAYNCGPGRVRRAMKESGATTFWELAELKAIPKETRGYVPTFYATLAIVADPQAYGFELTEGRYNEVPSVKIEGPVSLAYLASVIEMDEKSLRELNPHYRKGIVPPGRNPVRVPAKAASQLASLASSLKNDDAVMKLCSFTLRDSDTLETLASAIGIKTSEILEINGLKTNSLRQGDSVYLPIQRAMLSARLSEARQPTDSFYRVAQGDTLYGIAQKHGLAVDELRELNGLSKNDELRTGDRLRVTMGTALIAGGM